MPAASRSNRPVDEPSGAVRHAHEAAGARLEAAYRRDVAARARDAAAVRRDRAADARNVLLDRTSAEPASNLPLGQFAEQRALADEDRRAASADREQAALERAHALADCEALAREVATAETDPLTGARTRAAGLSDLERELARCRRVGASLVIAYIDVIGLKSLNDSAGHGAGDELLKRVVTTVQEHLRPYYLVVRVGGDEFVCAMPALPLSEARGRFAIIATALAAAPQRTTIRTGIAQLGPQESVAALIARADGDLVHGRTD
jgi:diguanylate cyclase (GGDEF)-like protein